MGAAKAALGALALLLLAGRAATARAEPSCTGVTETGGRFATCFDPGNRLLLRASTDGFGAVLQLRHIIHFDDEPDLVWKMEHTLVETSYLGIWQRYGARLYSGRYLRHARDGHIILPFSTARKLFLPFDVGAEADVGTLSQQVGDDTAHLGIVRTAALIDIGRSETFSRHLAFGTVARWDVDLANETMIDVVDHQDLNGAFRRLELQAELFLYGSQKRRSVRIDWRQFLSVGRLCYRSFGRVGQHKLPIAGLTRLVNDESAVETFAAEAR